MLVRGIVATTVAFAAVVLVLTSPFAGHASAAAYCREAARAEALRASVVTGQGQRVLVIGDSWSAGWRLRRPARSWPSRLPGRVYVDGFPGSGFSEQASPCGRVSFADRAAAAVRRTDPALVVVQGGLNDFDQSGAQVTAGFHRLMRTLHGHRVVVVGPATAPSRAGQVPRVDRLLARLSRESGVRYVRTRGLRLPYLVDRLHLTPAGHTAFGRYVAAHATGALRG